MKNKNGKRALWYEFLIQIPDWDWFSGTFLWNNDVIVANSDGKVSMTWGRGSQA